MNQISKQSEVLSEQLAEGIAAVMATAGELDRPEDMADLFLEELNRLWTEAADAYGSEQDAVAA